MIYLYLSCPSSCHNWSYLPVFSSTRRLNSHIKWKAKIPDEALSLPVFYDSHIWFSGISFVNNNEWKIPLYFYAVSAYSFVWPAVGILYGLHFLQSTLCAILSYPVLYLSLPSLLQLRYCAKSATHPTSCIRTFSTIDIIDDIVDDIILDPRDHNHRLWRSVPISPRGYIVIIPTHIHIHIHRISKPQRTYNLHKQSRQKKRERRLHFS